MRANLPQAGYLDLTLPNERDSFELLDGSGLDPIHSGMHPQPASTHLEGWT